MSVCGGWVQWDPLSLQQQVALGRPAVSWLVVAGGSSLEICRILLHKMVSSLLSNSYKITGGLILSKVSLKSLLFHLK